MAQNMCMVMMMVMVLVTVECATINQAIQDYDSCVTVSVDKCGGDEDCIYRCKWKCLKPHTPQVNLKDEAILPQEGGDQYTCVKYCRKDEFCIQNCLQI